MNNDKKEYPINGLENDCTSLKARSLLCYVNNVRGIKSFVKKQLNRRMRRYNKTISKISNEY